MANKRVEEEEQKRKLAIAKQDKIRKDAEDEARWTEEAKTAACKTLAEINKERTVVTEVYIPELKTKIKVMPPNAGGLIHLLKYKGKKISELSAAEQMEFYIGVLISTWGRADSTVTENELNNNTDATTLASIVGRLPKSFLAFGPLPLKESKQQQDVPKVEPTISP